MNNIEFKNEIKKCFQGIDSNFFDNIEKYKNFLQEVNKTMNLTRLDTDEKIYGEYFYESIIPYKNLEITNQKILDIGSGSGIPGIVIKLLYPTCELTIIESASKKCNFMSKLCELLRIDVKILNKRAEEIKEHEYEEFDIVTSRAVAPLLPILEISIPYAKVGGLIIEPKSKNYREEAQNIDKLLKMLKCKKEKIESFISINKKEHNVIYVKKINKTPREFPRKWSVIIQN